MWACKDIRPNGTLKWQKLIPVQTVEFVACIALPIIGVKMPLTQSWDWCWINHFFLNDASYHQAHRSARKAVPNAQVIPATTLEMLQNTQIFLRLNEALTSECQWNLDYVAVAVTWKKCGYLLYMNLWAALAILVLHFCDPALPSAIILWVCFENERFWKAKVVDLSGKKIG